MLPLLQKIRGQKDQIWVSVGRDSTERVKKYSVSTNVIQLSKDQSKENTSNILTKNIQNPDLSINFSVGCLIIGIYNFA